MKSKITKRPLLLSVQHKPLETRLKYPEIPLIDLIEPTKSVNRPDHSNEDTRASLCNSVLESIPLKKNTFHETALVAALGSGSKWVGALIDWSTGTQSFIAAFESKSLSLQDI
jgi:hypothetical protein